MPAADPVAIAARVAINVHRPSDDAAVLDAASAAIIMVATETGRADHDPPLDVPDDPLTTTGLVGLATALYLDQFAPGSSTVAVADPGWTPVGRARDPYADRRAIFDRLLVGLDGVA